MLSKYRSRCGTRLLVLDKSRAKCKVNPKTKIKFALLFFAACFLRTLIVQVLPGNSTLPTTVPIPVVQQIMIQVFVSP
jgi:hypothetical protein